MLAHLAKLCVQHAFRHGLSCILVVFPHDGAACIPYRSADIDADIEEGEIIILPELHAQGMLFALHHVLPAAYTELLPEGYILRIPARFGCSR